MNVVGWRSTDGQFSLVVEWQFGWLVADMVGRHNLVEGTGWVMVNKISVQSVNCKPSTRSFKDNDYWSVILVEGTGWVLVDDILVHSVNYRPSTGSFNVDSYWLKEPIECWLTRFQYSQSMQNLDKKLQCRWLLVEGTSRVLVDKISV